MTPEINTYICEKYRVNLQIIREIIEACSPEDAATIFFDIHGEGKVCVVTEDFDDMWIFEKQQENIVDKTK